MNRNASYYKAMFSLSESDLKLYRSTTKKVENQQAEFLKKFYAWIEGHPIFGEYYNANVIQGIRESEDPMWKDIIHFPMNDAYIEQQHFFGETFAEMGMPYDAYYACVVAYQEKLFELLQEKNLMTVELSFIFRKTLNIEAAIVSDSYQESTRKTLTEQNKALSEMSTPVTQLWDGILLLPLVGFIDSKRAQDIMTTMLDMISETQSKVFILDISGVGVVDTAVANYLIKITKATRLMGCNCMISGISGSVAQTIVELGIQIEEIETSGNMKEALNLALRNTGAKVVRIDD